MRFFAALLLVLGLVPQIVADEAMLEAKAPESTVPAPHSIALADLDVPQNWGMLAQSSDTAFDYGIDLDLIAPLGNGSGNAADFFVAFSAGEARSDEANDADRIEDMPWGKIYPSGDTLSPEAAPWCDQAIMRFYPGHFGLEGAETKIANYVFMITLARTWSSRGVAMEDPRKGLEELRRVIRLGRLARQDRVTLIGELVGIAMIKMGANGVFRIATANDMPELAVVASRVMHDSDGIRLSLMAQFREVSSRLLDAGESSFGGLFHSFDFDDDDVTTAITMAQNNPNRILRLEAMLSLALVRSEGSRAQRTKVVNVLEALAGDSDPVIANTASWAMTAEIDIATAGVLR